MSLSSSSEVTTWIACATVWTENVPNKTPIVQLVCKIAAAHKTTGTICHSLWAFVCAPEVISKLCAHNIVDDVVNAGATVIYGGADRGTIKAYEDGWLVSGKHPAADYMKETVTFDLFSTRRIQNKCLGL